MLAGGLAACGSGEEKLPEISVQYPETKKVDQKDTYFGKVVEDPYRWLEDDRSEETGEWVKAQNEVTSDYLEKIPFRKNIEERLTKLWNYPKYSSPFKRGENYFFYKNDGLQNQSVLYTQKDLEADPEVFINPNEWSEDGTVALSGLSFSNDNRYAAYMIARSGSDWREIRIMDVESRKILEDKVEWVKFSAMSWAKDGFFYSRYDKPEEGREFSRKNEYHKVFFHKVGTPQSEDRLVFEDTEHPQRNFYASTSEDGNYLAVMGSQGTSGNNVMVKDLRKPKSEFITVVDNFEKDHSIVDFREGELLMVTTLDAPNKRLVKVDLSNPAPENWQDMIAEKENLLESVSTAGEKLFVRYLENAYSKIYQYTAQGELEKEIKLPGIGSVYGFGGQKDSEEVFYTFTSFTVPSNIYRYTIENGESELFRSAQVDFDADQYETKQVVYTSKDGTEVPMFVVHKKGLELDGNNPTYLYGYGGFDISLKPGFSVSRLIWLEQGGIYAQPSLRGGGEFGQEWHEGGMLHNKQNVFDDFIAAGEFLIGEGYTSSERLAIAGGSNGGLLVGACMTQRPELFEVAFPAVGVLDMLRYHKFTIGWAWAVEYGSSEDSTHFDNLYGYSPLHNLKEGTEYPATMITTADHDDRVVPAHSFKFAATLQEKHAGNDPVLIRIETKAGHGSGKPTSKIIEEISDKYAFAWYNMGFVPEYPEEEVVANAEGEE